MNDHGAAILCKPASRPFDNTSSLQFFGYDDTLETVAKSGRAEVVWRGVKNPRVPHIFYLTQKARLGASPAVQEALRLE